MKNVLKVEMVAISRVRLNAANPRRHSARQIEQLATSIEEFGFTQPILLDGKREVVAGEGRYKAAKRLGLRTVPVIRLDGLSEEDRRLAYLIADNKLASMSEWDPKKLKRALDKIKRAGADVGITGFSDDDIARLMDDVVASTMGEKSRGSSRDDPDDDDDGDHLDGGDGQTGTLGVVLTVEDREEILEVLSDIRKLRKCMLGEALMYIVREWVAGRGRKSTTKGRR